MKCFYEMKVNVVRFFMFHYYLTNYGTFTHIYEALKSCLKSREHTYQIPGGNFRGQFLSNYLICKWPGIRNSNYTNLKMTWAVSMYRIFPQKWFWIRTWDENQFAELEIHLWMGRGKENWSRNKSNGMDVGGKDDAWA